MHQAVKQSPNIWTRKRFAEYSRDSLTREISSTPRLNAKTPDGELAHRQVQKVVADCRLVRNVPKYSWCL